MNAIMDIKGRGEGLGRLRPAGVPLGPGEDWFARERQRFLALKKQGLRRTDGSWVLP